MFFTGWNGSVTVSVDLRMCSQDDVDQLEVKTILPERAERDWPECGSQRPNHVVVTVGG